MSTATYLIDFGNSKAQLSGIDKVRLRDGHFWFWDDDNNAQLVCDAYRVRIVVRTDVDANQADDDVVELLAAHTAPLPNSPVILRIPGVKKVEVELAEESLREYLRVSFFSFLSDDDALPAGFARSDSYLARRVGAATTPPPTP